MKIGIIIYSKTGNTISVCEKLKERLISNGHDVSIAQIETNEHEINDPTKLKLTKIPDIAEYDTIILASPVHAFSLALPMKSYLSQITDLSSKRVYGFVTQHFKMAWMGGNNSIKKMKKLCASKGGDIKETGVINWSSAKRDTQIKDLLDLFGEI